MKPGPAMVAARKVRHCLAILIAIAPFAGAPLSVARADALERAAAAEQRGELRVAQIELRNAVRADPRQPVPRARLAQVSLELGEFDTAEREARAALKRGYSRTEGTRLLLRILLTQRKADEVLQEFPLREDGVPPAVAAQIAGARSMAELMLGRTDEAERMAAAGRRLAPNAVEPLLATADIAFSRHDLPAAEAALNQALTRDPNSRDALLRLAVARLRSGDATAAVETYARVIALRPADADARLGRAEAQMRAGNTRAAQEDIDAALRTAPNNANAVYMRAILQVSAQDWSRADESLQRLGPILGNFPDGFLLMALTKHALGQVAQAEDAAQRHFARRPEDPRGARLLAGIALNAGRPADAAAILARLADRGTVDAESLNLLATAHFASRQPAEAARAMRRAVELQPDNASLQLRLAGILLHAGDPAGSAEAAQVALRLSPDRPESRDILAAALLAQGRVADAQAQFEQFAPGWQTRELAATVDGSLRMLRYDLTGARASFSSVLRNFPTAVNARLGLAQVAVFEAQPIEAVRLLSEVLRQDPLNTVAQSRLAAMSALPGEVGTSALTTLRAAQAASPEEPSLAIVVASVLMRSGNPAAAAELLGSEPLLARGRGVTLPLLRAEAQIGARDLVAAELSSRTALAEDPSSVLARRQLAIILQHGGDARAAEAIIQEGLRASPGDAVLQQTLVGLTQQARGLDQALSQADSMANDPAAQPASRLLRGELLLGANRGEDAARAFAAGFAEAPSRALAAREATAWGRAGRIAEAGAALDRWLSREPEDFEVLGLRAQIDLQAGDIANAERRLALIVERRPADGVALNNLAWLLAERGQGDDLDRARVLAQRAFVLRPSAESADTFGWVLVKAGEARQAVPLLRAAAGAAGTLQLAGGIGYRLAFALNATGEVTEAREILRRVLEIQAQFPERSEAERLNTSLAAPR